MYFALISNIELVGDQTCFENHWCWFTALLLFVVCGKWSCISLFYYGLVCDTLIHSVTDFELSSNILLY